MARERAAKDFLSRLSAFTLEIGSYVEDMGETTTENRSRLRKQWETPRSGVQTPHKESIDLQSQRTQPPSDSTSTQSVVKNEAGSNIVDPPSQSLAGITPRLRKVSFDVTRSVKEKA